MKFPLAASPFPPVQLSPSQCDSYEQLATSLVQDTIAEYDHFVHVQQRKLNKAQWKPVKTRENLTVYKERSDYQTPASSESSSTSSGSSSVLPKKQNTNWSLPRLLAVGTIVGSLEDVMFGIIAPDIETSKIKTSYLEDEVIDARVLYQIQYATEEDPFRFLGLRWFAKAHPASVNAIVWPRDIVYIGGNGVLTLPNGEKLGYHLLQSVELPECPELSNLGLMRCQSSSCFLFKQQGDGKVEVYMKSHLVPGGLIPDLVALMSSANGLMGCWKSIWCAQNKKLSWMMQEAAAARARKNQFEDTPVRMGVRTGPDGRSCCALCEKKFPAFRSIISCELCQTVICSRCRTARKLSYVRRTGEVKMVATVFCKNCIAHSTRLSSTDVARAQFVPQSYYQTRRTRRGSQEPRSTRSHRRVESFETASVPTVTLLDDDLEINDIAVETIEEWEQQYESSFDEARSLSAEETVVPIVPVPTTSNVELGETPVNADNYQKYMWEQMTRLQLAAEETYQLAKQNTMAISGRDV